jgi:pimeloyl-ACP methyl ester carboxylesterase
MRRGIVTVLSAVVAWVSARAVVAGEAHEVQQARELIRQNGRSIVYFALPTYKYIGTGYNDFRCLSDGYELTFTFESKSFWRTNTTRIAFYFDTAGQFDYCKVLRSTTHYTPFKSAVGKKEIAKLRSFMTDHPAVRDSRKLLKQCDKADAKGLCELFLKLEQAKRNTEFALPSPPLRGRGAGGEGVTVPATPTPHPRPPSPEYTGKGRREPVSAVFVQVAPVPTRPAEFERSPSQKRAVVLVHGYRPEYDRFLTSRPVIQDWQEPDSFMVQALRRDADVFAFAYGQSVPVQAVAEAPELASGIARLKAMGYTDLVLLGHSAGGLVCRQFVEDHQGAGVTKVVQVCTPNGGAFWARFGCVACSTQKPYIASLTARNRRSFQRGRDGVIPAGVEFVCVVGDAAVRTDWVVSCRSQWSEDLQQQGIPAVRVRASHLNVVEKPESITAVARAVREPAPRWDRQRVQAGRHDILKN